MNWRRIGRWLGLSLLVLVMLVAAAAAWWRTHDATGAGLGLRYAVPRSVSPEARDVFDKLLPLAALLGTFRKPPRTAAEFDALNHGELREVEKKHDAALAEQGISEVELHLGGVKVLEIKPPQYRDDGTVLLRVHGGASKSDGGGDQDGAGSHATRLPMSGRTRRTRNALVLVR